MKKENEAMSDHLARTIMLGTGKFGGVINDEKSIRLMELYRELGGTVIDTGHCYGMFPPNVGRQPRAERAIGKFLQKCGRGNLLICTKGGYPDLDTGHSRLTKTELVSDVEASLTELGIDCIDIYYLHRDDTSIPVSDLVVIMNDLVRQGKIRALGVSNWSPERVGQANAFAEANGLEPFRYVQNLRNLGAYSSWPMNDPTMRITNQEDINAFAQMPGMRFVAYSAQAYGFFSKANPARTEEARALLKARYSFFDPEISLSRLSRIWMLANEHGVSPSTIVLSYVLSADDAPAVIIGCTREEQLIQAMENRNFRLTPDELAFLQ